MATAVRPAPAEPEPFGSPASAPTLSIASLPPGSCTGQRWPGVASRWHHHHVEAAISWRQVRAWWRPSNGLVRSAEC